MTPWQRLDAIQALLAAEEPERVATVQEWALRELRSRYPDLRPCGDRVKAGARCPWHEDGEAVTAW